MGRSSRLSWIIGWRGHTRNSLLETRNCSSVQEIAPGHGSWRKLKRRLPGQSYGSSWYHAPQSNQAPHRIGSHQGNDTGGHQRAITRLHQIGEHTGNEDKQKRHRREKKTCARQVGVSHPQREEEQSDREWRSVAEVARAWPRRVCHEGHRQGQHKSRTRVSQLSCHLAVDSRQGKGAPSSSPK